MKEAKIRVVGDIYQRKHIGMESTCAGCVGALGPNLAMGFCAVATIFSTIALTGPDVPWAEGTEKDIEFHQQRFRAAG